MAAVINDSKPGSAEPRTSPLSASEVSSLTGSLGLKSQAWQGWPPYSPGAICFIFSAPRECCWQWLPLSPSSLLSPSAQIGGSILCLQHLLCLHSSPCLTSPVQSRGPSAHSPSHGPGDLVMDTGLWSTSHSWPLEHCGCTPESLSPGRAQGPKSQQAARRTSLGRDGGYRASTSREGGGLLPTSCPLCPRLLPCPPQSLHPPPFWAFPRVTVLMSSLPSN